MKKSVANTIALAMALGADLSPLPQIKSPLPPKEKTQNDLDRLVKAEAKRLRKANKRIEVNKCLKITK